MRALLAVLLLSGIAGAQEPEPAPESELDGVLLERASRQPLAGVTVALPDLGQSALTDQNGHFVFLPLPAGTHRVQVSGPDLDPVDTEELLTGENKRVTYLVQKKAARKPYEATVR